MCSEARWRAFTDLLKMFGLVEKRNPLGRKELGQPSLGPLPCVHKGIVSVSCWRPWQSWSCQCIPFLSGSPVPLAGAALGHDPRCSCPP